MKEMKLWKFIFLLVFGSFVFMFVYAFAQTPLVLGLPELVTILFCLVAGPVQLCLYSGWVKLLENRNPSELKLNRMLPDVGRGFGIGFVYFIGIVVIMMVLGVYRIEGFGFQLLPTLKYLSMMFVVGIGEEIIFRGIIYRMVLERWGMITALVISSLVFGFIHYPNPGATVWSSIAIAVEAGIMLGLAYSCHKNLWLPIGIHWAWNFSQGQVWGIAVSGMGVSGSLFNPVIEGPELLTGGAFGAEASIIAVVLSLGISYLLYMKSVRQNS